MSGSVKSEQAQPTPLLRKSSVMRTMLKLIAPFAGLLIVLIVFSALRPEVFPTLRNFKMVSQQTVVLGICAVGMTFIMIGGGIDLSVGSVAALASVVLALCLAAGWPGWAGVALAVVVGGFCGLINGMVITGLRVIPFVATLGMMGIARGVARALASNSIVRVKEEPTAFVDYVDPLGAGRMVVAPSVWTLLVVCLLAGAILNFTAFGRRTFALGANEQACLYNGMRINRHKWWLYMIGGMMTGLAGVFWFANTTEGDPTSATGLELQVIAAVVIGGGSLMGGEGSILGTLVGALMLTFMVNGCQMAFWPNWVQEIAIGAIIIVAVAVDYFRRRSPA
jgi:ribose transport system permease protein